MGEHDHLTSPNLGGLDKFASEPERVDKPWGHELIWSRTDHYAGKILFVRAGESLSLQFHKEKDEAWYVLEGRARLEHIPGLVLLLVKLEAERLARADEENLAGVAVGLRPDQLMTPRLVHLLGLRRELVEPAEVR